jgi:DNA polymerase III delta prime subunit
VIARLLISSKIEDRVGEFQKNLNTHLALTSQLPEGSSQNHPDVLYFPAESKLGMEQARIIKDHFTMRPYQAKGRVLIIEDISNITLDAQNALLKTLEEPPEEALILMGATSVDNLLPTVLSRCEVVTLNSKDSDLSHLYQDVQKLQSYSLEDRFEYVEKLKDKEALLRALIQYFHQSLRSDTAKADIKFLKELLLAEEWAKQNVNIRGILEYLMQKMPTAK